MSVTVKYSHHFAGAFLVELQWHANQNTIAVGFLKATLHSTIFDIPMRPVREGQRHRRRFTC